jgi:nucleoside-diphosphate-sugar epimerase
VSGLARSDGGVRALTARGIRPVAGSLDDVDRLAVAAREVDAVVDTATADHAPSTATFLDVLAGTGKTYVRTSGTGVYTDLASGQLNEQVFTETSDLRPAAVVAARYESDLRVVAAAERDVRTVVIRPSMIYGDGASEQLPLLIRHAVATGHSLFAAPGENIWANVYLADLVDVYARALDKAAPGSTYNIAGGEAKMADIAGWVAELVGLPAASGVPVEEAYAAFGQRWVDVALASNSRVDSSLAREELQWVPRGPDLRTELVTGSYRRLWAHKGDPHDHVTR